MSSDKKQTSTSKRLVAGALAGSCEIVIMYPTEFVKTQLQLAKGNETRFKNSFDCAVRSTV